MEAGVGEERIKQYIYPKTICYEDKKWNNVELIHAGLSDHEDVMCMISNGDDTSYLCEEGTEETRICCIDDVLKGEKVSFIKLDVEGFELETLKGAEKIIKENHPRMAISVYHKESDLIDIPEYLLAISNNYKFMLRIYSNAYLEIVLYAI